MSETSTLQYWPEGILAARIPANNNVRLLQALKINPAISATTTAQPGTPAEGDVYILPASPTGAQWGSFFESDVVIFYNSTWTAYTPAEGLRKFVIDEGEDWQFVGDSSGGWALAGGGGTGVASVTAGAGIDVDATDPENPEVALDSASIASLALADSATQPGDAATTLNMATARILGRTTGGSGVVEEITIGAGLSLAAGSLTATGGGGGVASVNGEGPDSNGDVTVLQSIQIACSDLTTNITTGTGKSYFRMPYAFTLLPGAAGVRASVFVAQTAGSILTFDINENGTSILSTKLTIDNSEKTSTTAATPAVISDTSLANDAEITIDFDQVGTALAKGVIITLIGYPT